MPATESLPQPRLPGVLFAHSSAELYGADRILIELASGLRERGHPLLVVLPAPGPLHAELQRAQVQAERLNLGVLRRRYFSVRGLCNRLCRIVRAVRRLRAHVRTQGLQVVHSNTTAVLAGALAARWAGVPHVWHVHEITTRPRWFAALMARCVAALADRAVFVSNATMEHMCSLHAGVRRKATVIHNGIDVRRATGGRPGLLKAECDWPGETVVVGMIGRINWWKGQGALLDSVQRLVPSMPQLRCLMVGGVYDGEEKLRQDLLARVRTCGLERTVAVLDFRDDIANVLADLDIFVLPSTEPDPFPTVVLEAMAAGLPVVAFRHGGVCEMAEDGVTGLLCAPGDTAAMASAIERLACDSALREAMGAAGRARIARLFSRDAFIDRFSALYQTLATPA